MTARTYAAALVVVSGVTLGMATPPKAPLARNSSSELMTAFGRAVAIAGDFAFVGEPNVGAGGGRGGRGGAAPAGIVHVYRAGPTGWKEAAQLVSSATNGGDGFGSALAAEGSTLLVGQVRPAPVAPGGGRAGQAPPAPAAPDTAIGTVQVFRRGADLKWTPAGSLSAGAVPGGQFGAALALAGDLALVGAPGGSSGGTVHLFARAKDGSWSAAGTLPAQGLVAGDRFGAAVAVDGDRVAVGAPSRKVKGAVFVFRKDSTGTWIQETEQAAPSNLPGNAMLGASVAVKGDRVIAGAPGTDFQQPPANIVRDSLLARLATTQGTARDSVVNSLAAMQGGRGGRGGGRGGGQLPLGAGMVLVYQRASFGSWRIAGTLTPFDIGNVAFGAALGVVGNELWIGAPSSEGSGRIYRATADKDGAWTSMTKLGVDTIEAGAQWAASFAVSGNRAIVGMPGDGGGGGTVAFLNKAPTGAWRLAALNLPPVPERFQAIAKETKCENGKAAAFDCKDMNILSFMPISAIGGKRNTRLSGSWGWTDPVTGRDISIIGRNDGTSFVDVTDPTKPRYLGELPRPKGTPATSWREVKTYRNYALIVSDNSPEHGVQIFDLTKLRNVTAPRKFTEDAHFEAGAIHDIAVNNESGYAYALGTSSGGERCSGGSLFINMKNPLKPEFAGCFADVGTGRSGGGYTHDALCVNYKGPDTRFRGREICMASNETTVSIQDVTDKKNVKVLARADYPTPAYAHQGWFTEDQRYFFMNDELDESGNGGQGVGKASQGTRTMIFDVAKLDEPVMVKEYIGPTRATDHNLYVKGDRMYQSNYLAGLRVLDISDPVNPKEIGFLDTTPGENTPSMSGSWNNYPFFRNGAIGVVSIGEGFFMVKDVVRRVVQ